MAHVEANGFGANVPHFAEVADFVAPDDAIQEIATTTVDADIEDVTTSPPAEEEPDIAQRNLYFVRIPKPVVDDSHVKKLVDQFQKDIGEVKEFNSKLQAKRAELNELRNKLREARSLKDGGSPEFGEKQTMLKELRNKRDYYVGEIKAIRSLSKGLDCRSEDELDSKINELESLIRGGEISIRVERETVRQIAKLNTQREKVREFESQRDSLTQHEEELQFIKRCIEELESEFSMLRGEKDATESIIKEWKAKLDAKQAEMKELEELQQIAVDAKNRTAEQLTVAREDMDVAMKDYRDNRKFSATVRDLVESGQVDQAREMVEEQVEHWMQKLNTDAKFRAEYCSMWESQRRFPVSELLPSSSAFAKPAAPAVKGKAAPKPLVPQGRKKAEAIIAGLLESTKLELSERRTSQAETDYSAPESEPLPLRSSSRPEPKAIAPRPVEGLFNHKVELPSFETAYDKDFVPPVAKSSSPQLSEDELKAKVREEQRAKAKEAEERKKKAEKKKQEALEKKKLDAAEKKKQKEAAKKLEAAAPTMTSRQEEAQPVTDDSAVELSGEDETEPAQVVPQKQVVTRRSRGPQRKAAVEPAAAPMAKRPKKKETGRLAPLKKLWSQNPNGVLVGAGCVVGVILVVALIVYKLSQNGSLW